MERRDHYTQGVRFATRPPNLDFPPFRIHRRIVFRQTHFMLSSRFRQTSKFVRSASTEGGYSATLSLRSAGYEIVLPSASITG